ncbi:MAG: hypothetical protein JNN23_13260, partial [Chryseobacterium gambrini]|nr:hypothetical protein [Chryseobacterium gambrini]
MTLENKSYSENFLNILIEILKIKKLDFTEENVNDINDSIYILQHRITSEYHTINVDIEDNLINSQDISLETEHFVKKTLRIFEQIHDYLNENSQLSENGQNPNLIFNGFDEHDDIEEYFGAVDYAEYIINYKKKFIIFKDIFREGT